MPTMSTPPALTLNAVTATGAGTSVELSRFASNTNSIGLFTTTTGSPSAVSFTVEMSPDGTNWYTLSGSTLSATTATCQNYSIPPGAAFVRARLGTLTGGTSPTVTAYIAQRFESSV
jgi:streptogramin lyase